MKVLYTGFKGRNNSSNQLLSEISGEKLFLTNSFDGLKRDIMNISDTFDLVIMFGLDTNLKDTVRIECVVEYEGRIETTKADYTALCRCLEENDIHCIVSEMPTKYLCNAAYYHMLHKTDGKAVFIHIPSLKNMSEAMSNKLTRCVKKINISY